MAATERGIEGERDREREIEMDKCGDDGDDDNDDGSILPCAFLGLVMIPATFVGIVGMVRTEWWVISRFGV